MCGAKITRAAWAAACENRHSTRPHETLAEVQIAPRRHLQSHPPWVMANFKTVIRAHCVLYCAEVCSPAQFCFCLLVAVVFVHPPLDVSPIVSLQQWLIERDANERNEHRGLFFFLCHIQRASRPISADMIIVLFTPSLCLCRRISCVSNMLLSAHALSAVQRLCLNPPLPEAFLSPCYILV